jgi:hypothetical protein
VRRNRRDIALALHAMWDEKAVNLDSQFEQNIGPPNVTPLDQAEIMLANHRAWVDWRCAEQEEMDRRLIGAKDIVMGNESAAPN